MWMSSSSAANGKLPSLSSRSTASSPSSRASRSASVMTPRAASIRACARDCATSYGHRRRSKASELLSARKRSSCGSEKRDTERRLDGRKPVGDLGDLGGQAEPEKVQRRRPAEPRGLRRTVEAPVGVAHLLEDDRHEAGDAPEHEQPRRPARDQIAEPEMEPRRDLTDRVVPKDERQRKREREARRLHAPPLVAGQNPRHGASLLPEHRSERTRDVHDLTLLQFWEERHCDRPP